MSGRDGRVRTLLVAGLAAGALLAAQPGQDARAQPAAVYEDLPACGPQRATLCIRSFEVDVEGDGTFGPPPAGVIPSVTHMRSAPSSSMRIEARRSDLDQELAPLLTTASVVRLSVHLGTFAPTGFMYASGDVVSWTSTATASGRVDTFEVRPIRRTVGLGCTVSACDAPTAVRDYAAQGSVTLWSRDPVYEAQRVVDAQTAGGWIANNASAGSDVFMDSAARSLSIMVAAPSRTLAGAPNTGFLAAFVPDALIAGLFQTTPGDLVVDGVLDATEGGTTRRLEAALTRVAGGVRLRAEGFSYSAPTLRLRVVPRVPAPPPATAAGRLRSLVTMTVTPRRDRVPPYVLVVRGRVTGRGGLVPAACRGGVRVTVRAGRRVLATGTARLRPARRACAFTRRLAFTRRGRARRAVVTVTFPGSPELTPGRSAPRPVRLT